MIGIKWTLPGLGGFLAPAPKPAPAPAPVPIIDKKQKQIEDENIQLEAKRKAQRDRAASQGTMISSVVSDVGSEDKLGA